MGIDLISFMKSQALTGPCIAHVDLSYDQNSKHSLTSTILKIHYGNTAVTPYKSQCIGKYMPWCISVQVIAIVPLQTAQLWLALLGSTLAALACNCKTRRGAPGAVKAADMLSNVEPGRPAGTHRQGKCSMLMLGR